VAGHAEQSSMCMLCFMCADLEIKNGVYSLLFSCFLFILMV